MDPAVTQATTDVSATLANHIVKVKYEDIPGEVLEITRKQILDALAVTIGGSTAPAAKELVELAREWGGRGESTIIAYGDRVPAHEAALVNASMCDALDYDDTNDTSGVHSSTTVIPASFAIAERKGKVNGKDFLTAVTVGVDLVHRMGNALKNKDKQAFGGWEGTPLWGHFSTTAAASKLLGLDEKRIVNAIGIAYAQAAGNFQCIYDGAHTKRIQPGFAARSGIVSALMAEKGLTGAPNSLEGTAGLYNTYHRGNYDRNALTADLGQRFENLNVCFKAYPCCRWIHNALDATFAILKEHPLRPEDIDEVIITVGKGSYNIFAPLEDKRNPQNIVTAQFSVPWTVASALVLGKVKIQNYTEEIIRDPAILQMAQKISPKLDENLGKLIVDPAIVEIRTKDGRVLSKRADYPTGSPQNPMSFAAISDKLWECAPLSAKPIPEANLKKVIEMVRKLEEVDDVGAVIRLLG